MYIHKTTAQERLIIRTALDSTFIRLKRVDNFLQEVLESYFGDYKQKPIADYDAESIAYKLEIIEEILFDVMLEYSLTVGYKDFPGVDVYLEGADQTATTIEMEQLLDTVFPVNGNTCKRREIMKLPDKQAIAALKAEVQA